MISTLFSNPLIFIISIVGLLVAIAIHECAHAWAANELGDPTAQLQGRLTLNPLVHIDLTGLLFILFFGFGWGKATPFDPYNLKNPRKDAALISVAGPISNFLLALLLAILLRLFIFLKLPVLITIGLFLIPVIQFNIMLGVFNLLPIEPLDGFKIVSGLLPEEKAREWEELRRYGIIFLLALLFPIGSSSMLRTILGPVLQLFQNVLIPASLFGGGVV